MIIDKQGLVNSLRDIRYTLDLTVNVLDSEDDENLYDITDKIEAAYSHLTDAVRILSTMILTEEAQERGEYED